MAKVTNHFVGQDEAIHQINTAIEVSRRTGKILPHMLFIAPPGMGKTMLAQEVAWASDAPFTNLVLPAAPRNLMNHLIVHEGILLLDEIHQLDRKGQDMLLTFLTDGVIRYNLVNRDNKRLTIIGATTDPQSITDALMSRFRLKPTFREYNTSEIKELLVLQNLSEEDAEILSKASLCNPRQAMNLCRTLKDLRVLDKDTPAEQVLEHLKITQEGLCHDHLQYLEALQAQNGMASQTTLASMLFMPTAAMHRIERELLRLGIIGISSGGRELRSIDWLAKEQKIPKYMEHVNPYTMEPYE